MPFSRVRAPADYAMGVRFYDRSTPTPIEASQKVRDSVESGTTREERAFTR